MTDFDRQVNGFAGVDFNAPNLTPAQLATACRAYRAAGGGRMLATLITAPAADMQSRLRTLVRCRAADEISSEVIAGIHIEGPFLNPEPGYIGAHPAASAVPGSVSLMDDLLAAGNGLVRLVTLAPECDPGLQVTMHLATHKIIVAAGHTNATGEQLDAALAAGLTQFTHLGNGCPLLLPRQDSIINRVLARADRFCITLIPDGVHVPFFVLKLWLKLIPPENVRLVTDATAAAGLGPGTYTLGHQTLTVGPDGAAWSLDRTHLIGSTLTPTQLQENVRTELSMSDANIQQSRQEPDV